MRVVDVMSWATNKREMKQYLGLDGDVSEDIKLRLWLEAAIEAADLYLDKDFILNKARFVIESGVGDGDLFELQVIPDDDSGYSVSYTASSGDTSSKVASELREDLAESLDGSRYWDFEIYGAGPNIWVYSGDPEVAFQADATYTPSGGTSGIVETYFYDDIPSGVKIGVYEYVKALREIYRRAIGLKGVKTGQLAETYGGDGMTPNDVAFQAGKGWWSRWKKDLLIDGNGD